MICAIVLAIGLSCFIFVGFILGKQVGIYQCRNIVECEEEFEGTIPEETLRLVEKNGIERTLRAVVRVTKNNILDKIDSL